ncbi:MAG: DNA polymerase [Dehalococcoidia bacterium]
MGEKTAVKLLDTFDHIENIYEYLWQVKPPKVQEALRANEEQARQSKQMATIVTDCPVTLNLDGCRVGDYDRDRVTALFHELEFRSLLARLPEVDASLRPDQRPAAEAAVEAERAGYTIISDAPALDALMARIRAAGWVAFDTETTSQSAMQARLVGVSLSCKAYEGFYIPVGHAPQEGDPPQLPLEEALAHVRPVLEDPAITKVAHNAKYDIIALANAGIRVQGLVCDTMVAAYLLGEGSLGLKPLAFDRLGVEMTQITELIGSGRKQITMAEVPVERAGPYACADADLTGRLRGILEAELREKALWDLFTDIEMPLVDVLVNMEMRGVALDTDVLREMSQYLSGEIGRVEAALHEAAGETFNINSPAQLSRLLFDRLDLPKTRKTSLGYSTDAQALASLRGVHPVVDLLFEYRELTKLRSTYVDALPGMVNPRTGRIHTTYNQTRAATGRLSSEDPNLQNIPVRTELGRRVRRAFVARDGVPMVFVSADYSQVELRILAHICKEPFLVEAFRRDEDIHRATASQLFSVALGDVTYEQRQLAKTINFAVLYGLSAQGLSTRTEMNRTDAIEFIRTYFERYPNVKRYLDETIAETRARGYASTLLGRRRYLPDISRRISTCARLRSG